MLGFLAWISQFLGIYECHPSSSKSNISTKAIRLGGRSDFPDAEDYGLANAAKGLPF